MKKERIRAIFRKPLTNKSEIVEVENTVEGIQEMIGGHFECVTIEEGICLLCDEDGKLKRLQPNCIYRGDIIAGPILIVGTQGDEFTSIPELFAERFMKKERGTSRR